MLLWGPVALLWGTLFWRLKAEWQWSETYRFGFWVPVLGAMLLWNRHRNGDSPATAPTKWITMVAALVVGISLLPCDILWRANPDWRGAFWIYGIIAMTSSYLWLSVSGGISWANKFLPVLGFLLLAIPWPTFIEQPVVEQLSRLVALISVAIANQLGFSAEAAGNVILVIFTGKHLGVEEACSGLRSLQASVMAAWFLGEWMRLTRFKRLVLIVVGVGLAVVLNTVRVVTLIVLATGGTSEEFFQVGHDEGSRILAVMLFAILVGIAWKSATAEGDCGEQRRTNAKPIREWGGRSAFVFALALGTSIVVSNYWFSDGCQDGSDVEFPSDLIGRSVPIPSEIRAQLRYSQGQHVVWYSESERARIDVFRLRWDAERISSFAGIHRPDVCLPAAGVPLEKEGDVFFTDYSFQCWRGKETPLWVFYTCWDNGKLNRAWETSPGSLSDRLHRAWKGERIDSRDSIQIVVSGLTDRDAAMKLVKRYLVMSAAPGPIKTPHSLASVQKE